MLDTNLTMGLRIKALSKSCFYDVHSSLDDAMAASVASALVLLHLYQMSSVLHCVSKNCNLFVFAIT